MLRPLWGNTDRDVGECERLLPSITLAFGLLNETAGVGRFLPVKFRRRRLFDHELSKATGRAQQDLTLSVLSDLAYRRDIGC